MKQLIEDIRRLSRTWEIWVILGFVSLMIASFNMVFNRAPSMKEVEANLRRIEHHLEVIDGRDESSIHDRVKIKKDLSEIKKELP